MKEKKERPFLCDKAFKKREIWKKHKVIHNNKRPFSCDIWAKASGEKKSLRCTRWIIQITYKILTWVIANRIYNNLDYQQLISTNQKGYKRKSQGTKDHLLINKAIMENAKIYNKNLYMAWID